MMSANDVVDLSTMDNGEKSGSDGSPSANVKPEVRFGRSGDTACVTASLRVEGRGVSNAEANGVNANPAEGRH